MPLFKTRHLHQQSVIIVANNASLPLLKQHATIFLDYFTSVNFVQFSKFFGSNTKKPAKTHQLFHLNLFSTYKPLVTTLATPTRQIHLLLKLICLACMVFYIRFWLYYSYYPVFRRFLISN